MEADPGRGSGMPAASEQRLSAISAGEDEGNKVAFDFVTSPMNLFTLIASKSYLTSDTFHPGGAGPMEMHRETRRQIVDEAARRFWQENTVFDRRSWIG